MQRILATAASGLDAAQQRVSAVSHNLANLGTDRFRRQTIASTADPAGGVQTRVTMAAQPGPAIEAVWSICWRHGMPLRPTSPCSARRTGSQAP